jgi:hypothetical protein
VEFVLQPGETRDYELTVISTAGVQTIMVASPDSWMHPAKLTLYLAEGDALISTTWTVLAPIPWKFPPPSGEHLVRVPEKLIVDGTEIKPIPVVVKEETFDMAPLLGGTADGRTAWLYIPFEVKQGGKTTLGFGADWWMQAWVDGQPVCDTTMNGNGQLPPSPADHVTTVDLTPGNHLLVVRFVSGSMGSLFAVGGPEEVRRAWAT